MILEALFVVGVIPASISQIEHPMTRNAIRSGALAYYKQINYDKKIDKLEKQYITKDMRRIGTAIIWIGGVIEKKQITYGWSF